MFNNIPLSYTLIGGCYSYDALDQMLMVYVPTQKTLFPLITQFIHCKINQEFIKPLGLSKFRIIPN